RLGLAALAGGVVALHAATWSGWVLTGAVLTAGFGAAVLLSVLRTLARRERVSVAAWTAATGVVFAMATTVGVVAAGTSIDALSGAIVDTLAPPTAPPVAPPPIEPAIAWPDVFATVRELSVPRLADVAELLEGPLYFFVAWLGLLLLLLPARRWQWWHFVVLIAGNFLYRYLVTATGIGPWVLVRRAGDRRPRPPRAPRRARRGDVVPGGAGAELRGPPVRHAPGTTVRDPPRGGGGTAVRVGASRDHPPPRRRLAYAARRCALRGARGGRDPDRRARRCGGARLPADRARRVVGHPDDDPRDGAARWHRDRLVGLRTLHQVHRRTPGNERRQHAFGTGGALDRANAPRADRARGDRPPPHARLRLRRRRARCDGPPRRERRS